MRLSAVIDSLNLTTRQRADFRVIAVLAGLVFLAKPAALALGLGPVNATAAVMCYAVAVMCAVFSLITTLSWFFIRPEPPGSQDGVFYATDPPVWFIILRPIVLIAAVWLAPANAWALLVLALTWLLLGAASLPFRTFEGSFETSFQALKRAARRAGYVCPT